VLQMAALAVAVWLCGLCVFPERASMRLCAPLRRATALRKQVVLCSTATASSRTTTAAEVAGPGAAGAVAPIITPGADGRLFNDS
jgi:hypothetical protein